MKKIPLFILATCILLALTLISFSSPAYAKSPSPLLSTDWLAQNSGLEELVIVDIRTSGEYQAGHIPNAINIPFEVPFSAWITMRDDLLLELPDEDDLFDVIGSNGIDKHSLVLVVTSGAAQPPYPLANATRVADTLIYAGVKDVSILEGGFAKWVAEGKATTTEVPAITPVDFGNNVEKKMFVSIDYVKELVDSEPDNRSVLIDARDAEVYNGSVTEPWTDKAGHIPTAKSLPTPWIWNEDGTYRSVEELDQLVLSVVGDKDKEIVVYCGVGGYASTWWFVLTEVLDYKHVKIFDGSAQEWGKYYDMVLD